MEREPIYVGLDDNFDPRGDGGRNRDNAPLIDVHPSFLAFTRYIYLFVSFELTPFFTGPFGYANHASEDWENQAALESFPA